MSNPVAARKDGQWLVVGTSPSVNLTPQGPGVLPVPYPVTSMLSQAKDTSSSVNANGAPLFVYGGSLISQTLGDQAGVNNGIMSGTMGADTWPKEKTDTVRSEKKNLVRMGDKCWMNGTCPWSAGGKKAAELLEIKSRIAAGKINFDPQVREAATDLEQKMRELQEEEMALSVRDPSVPPPAGWLRGNTIPYTGVDYFVPDPATLLPGETPPPGHMAVTSQSNAAGSSAFAENLIRSGAGLTMKKFEIAPPAPPPMIVWSQNPELRSVTLNRLQQPAEYEKKASLEQEKEYFKLSIEAKKAECEALLAKLPQVIVPAIPLFGNTEGIVVGFPPMGGPASDANPVVQPETKEEVSAMEWVHLGLDTVGLVDVYGIGTIADLINAAIYAVEGDTSAALTSLFCAIPFVGSAATVGKAGKTAQTLHKAFNTASKVTSATMATQAMMEMPGKLSTASTAFQEGHIERGVYSFLEVGISSAGATQTALGLKPPKNEFTPFSSSQLPEGNSLPLAEGTPTTDPSRLLPPATDGPITDPSRLLPPASDGPTTDLSKASPPASDAPIADLSKASPQASDAPTTDLSKASPPASDGPIAADPPTPKKKGKGAQVGPYPSVILRENMEKAGIVFAKYEVAHHIVPVKSEAAKILEKYGIDINSPENGVALAGKNTPNPSGIIHNGRHPDSYLKAVNERLMKADKKGGKEAVLKEIKKIGGILKSAPEGAKWGQVLTP